MDVVVVASAVDSRLWRTPSDTGDRDPSSRTGRGGSATTPYPVVSGESLSPCDECLSGGSTFRGTRAIGVGWRDGESDCERRGERRSGMGDSMAGGFDTEGIVMVFKGEAQFCSDSSFPCEDTHALDDVV